MRINKGNCFMINVNYTSYDYNIIIMGIPHIIIIIFVTMINHYYKNKQRKFFDDKRKLYGIPHIIIIIIL